LKGKHFSQLCYWGFSCDSSRALFRSQTLPPDAAAEKVIPYLVSVQLNVILDDAVHRLRTASEERRADLKHALSMGAQFKAGDVTKAVKSEFLTFLKTKIARRLKPHQIKAAIHLLAVGNGANFSVPGSGKTSVALAVFHWLRSRGELNALFVVGPPSCFAPWKNEYKAVIGVAPSCEILAGGDIDERNAKYLVGKTDLPDLYLTSFQTLLHDWEKVRFLLNQPEHRFVLVVDEAHYIKQLGGAWANAVLNVAKSAKARWILTGTPFPCSYADAFNAFDVLWPDSPPITQRDRLRIQQSIQAKDPGRRGKRTRFIDWSAVLSSAKIRSQACAAAISRSGARNNEAPRAPYL
jgi:hypothetical protein